MILVWADEVSEFEHRRPHLRKASAKIAARSFDGGGCVRLRPESIVEARIDRTDLASARGRVCGARVPSDMRRMCLLRMLVRRALVLGHVNPQSLLHCGDL